MYFLTVNLCLLCCVQCISICRICLYVCLYLYVTFLSEIIINIVKNILGAWDRSLFWYRNHSHSWYRNRSRSWYQNHSCSRYRNHSRSWCFYSLHVLTVTLHPPCDSLFVLFQKVHVLYAFLHIIIIYALYKPRQC